MASLISWIAMIIVGILVVLFAISNRSVVILELWPLPYFIPFPFYGAVLIAAFIGFVGGSVVAWFSAEVHAAKLGTLREKPVDWKRTLINSRKKLKS